MTTANPSSIIGPYISWLTILDRREFQFQLLFRNGVREELKNTYFRHTHLIQFTTTCTRPSSNVAFLSRRIHCKLAQTMVFTHLH